MKHVICLLVVGYGLMMLAACRQPQAEPATPCAEALIAYAERYPASEPTDLYKLVFQNLYGPGHMVTDSAMCAAYIEREVAEMTSPDHVAAQVALFPLFEYTLCDSSFVRVNLSSVADGRISVSRLVHAVLCSTEGLPQPDPKFVLSHSQAFKQAYDPHYRLVRRDIFEREILPLIAN